MGDLVEQRLHAEGSQSARGSKPDSTAAIVVLRAHRRSRCDDVLSVAPYGGEQSGKQAGEAGGSEEGSASSVASGKERSPLRAGASPPLALCPFWSSTYSPGPVPTFSSSPLPVCHLTTVVNSARPLSQHPAAFILSQSQARSHVRSSRRRMIQISPNFTSQFCPVNYPRKPGF